jgi:hypothetical protein
MHSDGQVIRQANQRRVIHRPAAFRCGRLPARAALAEAGGWLQWDSSLYPRCAAGSDLIVMHPTQHSHAPTLDLSNFPRYCAQLGAGRVPGRPGHQVGADDPAAGPAHARELATLVTESQLRNDQVPDP